MWFPTKRKVTWKLAEFYGLSMNLESRLAAIESTFDDSAKIFGPLEGLPELRQELADTTQALYLASAAIHCEQVSSRAMAKRLPFFEQCLLTYQNTIASIEQSTRLIRQAA